MRFLEYLKLTEGKSLDTLFVVDKNKFKLFLGNSLVSETGFNIESPDKWFNKKYVTLHDLKTIKKFQGKGYSKHLLRKIFEYVKDKLDINLIALIVDKDNKKALNLYLHNGFEIFKEYDDSFSLIKKLEKTK